MYLYHYNVVGHNLKESQGHPPTTFSILTEIKKVSCKICWPIY